jgi:hypothetical protein
MPGVSVKPGMFVIHYGHVREAAHRERLKVPVPPVSGGLGRAPERTSAVRVTRLGRQPGLVHR